MDSSQVDYDLGSGTDIRNKYSSNRNDIRYKPTQLSSHNLFKPSDQDRKIDRFSLLCYTGPHLMVTQVPGQTKLIIDNDELVK